MIDEGKLKLVKEAQKEKGEISIQDIKLDTTHSGIIAAAKQLADVPIRKPGPMEPFRAHATYHWDILLLERRQGFDRQLYAVLPDLWTLVHDLVAPVRIYPYMTSIGALRLWPIRIPLDGEEDLHPYHRSAHRIIEISREEWIWVKADRTNQCYVYYQVCDELNEPEWPDKTMEELAELAFRKRIISSVDDSLLVKLGVVDGPKGANV